VKCKFCGLDFGENETQMGAGTGFGQDFAHEVCYWRHRSDVWEKAAIDLHKIIKEAQKQIDKIIGIECSR
jgi:hypothetical protein